MMKQKNKSFWSLMGLPGFVWYAVLGLLSPVVSRSFCPVSSAHCGCRTIGRYGPVWESVPTGCLTGSG